MVNYKCNMSQLSTSIVDIKSKNGTPRSCLCGKLLHSNHFIEYTEKTTIHGVKYLGARECPIVEKIFWILIFTICFVFLGMFINDILTKWQLKSTILVDDEQYTPIYHIPFPAVTICPTTKIKQKFMSFQEYDNFVFGRIPKPTLAIELAQQICNQQFINPKLQFDKNFNKSHIDELHKISPAFQDLFNYIKFQNESYKFKGYRHYHKKNKTSLFSPILTNEGICFTFNLPAEIITDEPTLQTDYRLYNISNMIRAWDCENGYTGYPNYPRTTWCSGKNNALEFMVRSQFNDSYTICQPTQIGYNLILHSPAIYPTTLEHFIPINYNTVTIIEVTPLITKTLSDLRNYNPNKCQCFYNDERKLKYYKFYNRVNCKLECVANYTLLQYNCVHFSMPRSANESICGGNVKIHHLFEAENNINSYHRFRKEWNLTTSSSSSVTSSDDIDDFDKFLNFQCNCLPECISLEYDYSIYTESINLNQLRKNENRKHKDTQLAQVIIYFKSTKITGKTRKQFYTFSDLVSNFGGLVGLFMGASVLSVFEIIYFFIVRNLASGSQA